MGQYLGEIRIFFKYSIPEGFLICDGRKVFINEYPRLYMVIGCQYGGDEKINFRLPKLHYESDTNMVYCIATEGENA